MVCHYSVLLAVVGYTWCAISVCCLLWLDTHGVPVQCVASCGWIHMVNHLSLGTHSLPLQYVDSCDWVNLVCHFSVLDVIEYTQCVITMCCLL